ncbi:MAG TPA: M48 family metalloprotease [Bauldia sp.]|nr:M48 family metalloprotease [Bauldia sp.]
MAGSAGISRPLRGWKGRLAGSAIALLLVASLAAPPARADGIPIVRDAETEALLADYLRPIIKVAGVPMPKIHIVPSDEFNAFVTDNGNLFVNTGAIIETETPNELIGILAHETGHIVNQDTARFAQQLADTKTAMLIASLVGAGAAVAGAATGSPDAGQAGMGIFSATPGVAERSLLTFRRDQESGADRNAVKFMNATHQSSAGMLAVMKRLADQALLLSQQINPYLQTHPLPRERVTQIEDLIAGSPYTNAKDPPDLQRRHDLVRAKLIGFTWSADKVLRRYPMKDQSLPAKYARAILAYRTGKPGPAQQQIDDLIKVSPNDAYFYELKGQALIETGSVGPSIAAFRKAVALAPGSSILKILLGQALVAQNSPAAADEVISLLTVALQREPDMGIGYRSLARAYAMKGNEPMAQLATAEGLFADGSYDDARIQAIRAQAKLKKGSPGWLRADDIASYKPQTSQQ